MRTALGFRTHSGWAAMVEVAGLLDSPRILDRRRMVIADPEIHGSRQPYHAAAQLPLAEAEALIRNSVESSRGLALEGISLALRAVRAKGHEVAGCAILRGSGRPLPVLERILAAHPLIHTAEGELFRDALEWAARECQLPVIRVMEKDIDPSALECLHGLGSLLGPPWTQDQNMRLWAVWWLWGRVN
ncbi:MAG: hypothetical protein U0Q18_26215 [Bryobacteraceae bacterium]